MGEDREEDPRPKRAVKGMWKLSTPMHMSEDDTGKRECECETLERLRSSEGSTWCEAGRRRNLEGDVPTTAGETEHHADGEENTPYEGLETDVEE